MTTLETPVGNDKWSKENTITSAADCNDTIADINYQCWVFLDGNSKEKEKEGEDDEKYAHKLSIVIIDENIYLNSNSLKISVNAYMETRSKYLQPKWWKDLKGILIMFS